MSQEYLNPGAIEPAQLMNHTSPPSYAMQTDEARYLSRTPSPTPSEQRALEGNGRMGIRQLFNRRNLKTKIALVIVLVLIILLIIYHNDLVNWLSPVTSWLQRTDGSWAIMGALVIIWCFPPLFGQEIVHAICGLVWGLGKGFIIVAVGTFIGEMANFFVFKYACMVRAKKIEQTNIRVATIAYVIRNGGFFVTVVARYSWLPPHWLTPIFSTCGMNVFTFAAAVILSLPKQLVSVYMGSLLASNSSSQSETIGHYFVVGLIVVSVIAGLYIRRRLQAATPMVVYERRKARQPKFDNSAYWQRPSGPMTA